MPDKEEKNQDFLQTDPDLNEEENLELDNFDEPFPRRSNRRTGGPAGRVSSNIEQGLGTFFNRLNEVANFLNDLAEKTEQAAQQAAERRQQANGNQGENNAKGFAARWGINTNILNRPGSTPFTTNRPPFTNPFPTRTPGTTSQSSSRSSVSPASPDAESSLREPYLEIHDESEDGLIIVIAEMPGVEEPSLQVEIQDDVIIIRGEGAGYRYEKESLLPAVVQSEPQSRSYQNGLLELRLKIRTSA